MPLSHLGAPNASIGGEEDSAGEVLTLFRFATLTRFRGGGHGGPMRRGMLVEVNTNWTTPLTFARSA